ncbi:MAG: peptidylprolyl isomerase, partial [Pseudomonadota bacterium]|nr:peptidylprolyl isomerase [Pseudomonadota bacterium]
MNFILLLFLVCWAQFTAAEPQLLDYIVAVVNEDVIVHSELQQQIEDTQQKLREQNIPIPPKKELKQQVLEHLIITKLQLQLAERLGITLDEETLNATLRDIAAQNNSDLTQFRNKLAQSGYRYEDFRQHIREKLLIQKLQQRQVVNRINVSEQEIKHFLANQSQQGHNNEEYHLLHILIATSEAPAPEEIEARHQKARQVIEKLKQGADFKATAVAVSDSRQALEGGDLGWMKAGEMPSLFEGMVPKMAVGEIKGPIRNASGFHIIQLADKRGGQQALINQTQVRHILIKTDEFTSDFEAQERLQQLKMRIELGEESFATLARGSSDDPTSAAQGGDLGWVNPGDMAPE